MKLYEIPEGSKIKAETESDGRKGEWIKFFHIDGMYSYCETEHGVPVHIFAGTELKKEGDYYIIDEHD